MTVKFYSFSTLLFALTLLASCSLIPTSPEDKQSALPATDSRVQKTSIEDISKKLTILIEAAKKAGPEAVSFLADDIYLKASASSIRGDYQTSSLLLGHLIKLVPEDQFVKSQYAISLIREGKTAESKQILEKIYKDSKWKNERIGLILAGVYSSLSDQNSARKIYNRILKNNPQSDDACLFTAKSYAIEKKFKQAQEAINKCLVKNPKSATLYYYQGKIHLAQEKIKNAKLSFEKTLNVDPDYFQAIIALGIIYEEQGNPDKAIALYKNYLDTNPNDSAILSRLVQTYFAQEKYDEVIPYAQRLVDLEPEDLNLRVKLGILYTDVQKFDQAIKLFKEILVQIPDSDRILYYLGAIYQETKQFEEAVEHFTKIKPDSILYTDAILQAAQLLSTISLVHKSQSDSEDKETRFLYYIDEKINNINNPIVELSVIKANYYETISQNRKAINILEKVQNDKEFTDNHRYYLASLYEKERRFDLSSQIILKIIEADPENAHAWNFLGYSLLERDIELSKAYEYITKAVKLAPNDGYILDSLGWYYYKIGQYEKALAHLKKARKGVDNDATISKHLGIVYKALEDVSMAKKYFTEALNNSQTEIERNDINQYLLHLEQLRRPASKDE